jgi:hypothetical protein
MSRLQAWRIESARRLRIDDQGTAFIESQESNASRWILVGWAPPTTSCRGAGGRCPPYERPEQERA